MADRPPKINREWLHGVRETYLSTAAGKLNDLERAISGLELNPTSRTHERRLRRLLHNLIGSGSSYGFPTVTDTARRMSECLSRRRDDGTPVEPEILADLRARLEHLRKVFEDARA